jgi:hypothetical protein
MLCTKHKLPNTKHETPNTKYKTPNTKHQTQNTIEFYQEQYMSTQIKKHQWVYVVIQNPNSNPQYLGQQEEDTGISFIPVFLEKEDALMCLNLMTRDKKTPVEAQAVIYEELAGHAVTAGFQLYLLNKAAEVIEKIAPSNPN